MSATMQTRIVRVLIEQREGGYYFATSPNLKGLLVVEPTLEAVEKAIPQAITDLYTVSGQPVVVTRLEETDRGEQAWVTTPVAVMEQALQALRERARLRGA